MADLIEKALKTIFPESDRIENCCAYGGGEGGGGLLAGLEEVKERRAKGEFIKPVLVYGFDPEERIRKQESGSILDAPGIFYLRLPAFLSEIEGIFEEAANTQVPENKVIDDRSFRDYAIREIKTFKHRCDNLWTSMEMNANRARRALDNSPGSMPSALLEFSTSKVEKLAEEYSNLAPKAERLGITDSEKVKGTMDEVIEIVRQIQDKKTSPHAGVNLAFQCVEKVQAVSSILEKAKELE